MRVLATALLVFVTADGGVSAEFRREVILARIACADSDGGLPPRRIGACVVTCSGEYGDASLVDGGVCYPPENPVIPGGDFWPPGERPLEKHRRRR